MIITLHSEVYPIETILQTCYLFIDRAYFHIDLNEAGNRLLIKISFKGDRPQRVQAKEFRGKFMEELLHASLRYTINQRNQKLREYIVGSALFSHDPSEAAVTPPEDVPIEKETELTESPLNDPLGTASWAQRNGK